LLFVMTPDSVRPESVCKNEWVRAVRYKKPVIPLLRHRDAELPFGLGSREYVNFTGDFETAIARLRNHLSWLDSPQGQLLALKHRLADAERDLPRAEPDQQALIQEEIDELKRQIVQQQKVIDNPEAVAKQVSNRVEAVLEGERQPVKPVAGIATSRFINPIPMIAPTWFQDRHFESAQIGAFLKDESLRLMTVVGRGGVGKTAMVCRLLRSLEGGQLPDDGGPLTVDGIVYLSAARSFHRTTVPDLYAGLTKLLPDEIVRQLDALYKNPQTPVRALMEALAGAFPSGRTVVLLDNFEDMLSVDTGVIRDAELNEALRAFLEIPPHGLKLVITTRVAPGDLAQVQPGLQRRLDLDAGLDHPFAENILRSMDVDGKVGLQKAPDALLAKARERTLGYPRALEHLFGILSADRSTSLQEILENTDKLLPEKVVEVLVGEAFSRLDPTAQRVMQALAVFRYPVPPGAVDYLLQPYVPGIDSGRVLGRLLNMQFVRRDAGRYYLHQIDRDFALGRIPEGTPDDRDEESPPLTRFALRHRAAEWFRLSRKPREAWKTLDDLAAQLSEFELRCEGSDYDTAAMLLLEFDFDYLHLWGHFRLMSELHERLQGHLSDPVLVESSAGNLATAYSRMGEIRKAITLYEQALQLAQSRADRDNEGTWLNNLGMCFGDLGQNARAIDYYQRGLAIKNAVGNRSGESTALGNLGTLYSELGDQNRSLEFYLRALAIDRELQDAENESLDLQNLGECYKDLGQTDDAVRCFGDALCTAQRIGYRMVEAALSSSLGDLRMSLGAFEDAAVEHRRAIEIADEIGLPIVSKAARESLAWVNLHLNNLSLAREMADAACKYDIFLSNHRALAVLGVVAVRQGDLNSAAAAFSAASNHASQLIDLTPNRYAALDIQGLSLCGLVLCRQPEQIQLAKAAYKAARALTSNLGVVRDILQRFDALSKADTKGLLAEVRPFAAGTKSQ